MALFLWSQQQPLLQACIPCLISVPEAEGMRCHLRCPTCGTGCVTVLYPRRLKSLSCGLVLMWAKVKEESREMESNSKVTKVVQTCCSSRRRCSSLSACPLALAGEFVLLPPTTGRDSGLCRIPRNSGQWRACCAGLLWADPDCQATLRVR